MTAKRVSAFALVLAVSLAAVAAVKLALPPPSEDAAFVSLPGLNSVVVREDAGLNRSCDGAPFWVGTTGMTSKIDVPPRVCPDSEGLTD